MTISTQSATVVVSGNGATTSFNYSFLIPYQSDGVTPAVQVSFVDALGNASILAPTAYTISGVGNSSGGSVTYNPLGVPIATGQYLIIRRHYAYTQPIAVSNNSFYPHVVEQLGDDLVMQIQQLKDKVNQAPQVVPSPSGIPGFAFPDPTGLSGLFLGVVAGAMAWVAGPGMAGPVNGKVDVAYYGAVGNNITDDAPAIGRAIAFANSSNTFKTVIFGGASYYLGSGITSPNGVSLEGQLGTTLRKTFPIGDLLLSVGKGNLSNITAFHDYTGMGNIDASQPANGGAIVNPCTSGYVFNIQTPTYSLYTNCRVYGGIKAMYTFGGAFCTFLNCTAVGAPWDPTDSTMQLSTHSWHEDGNLTSIPTCMQKLNCIASGLLYSGPRNVLWAGNGPTTVATNITFTANGSNQIVIQNATPQLMCRIVRGMVLTSGAVTVPANTYATGVNPIKGLVGLINNIPAGTYTGTLTGGCLATVVTATVTETAGSQTVSLASTPTSLGLFRGALITAGNMTGRIQSTNDGAKTMLISTQANFTGNFPLTFSRQTVMTLGPRVAFEISCCEGSSWLGGFVAGGSLYNTYVNIVAGTILKNFIMKDFQGDTCNLAALMIDSSSGTSPTDLVWEPAEQTGQNCSGSGVSDECTTNLQGIPSVIGLRLGGTVINMIQAAIVLQRAQAVTSTADMNVRGYNSLGFYSNSDLQDLNTGWYIGAYCDDVVIDGKIGGGSTGSDSYQFDDNAVISPNSVNSIGNPGPGYPPNSYGAVPSRVNYKAVPGQNTTMWKALSR